MKPCNAHLKLTESSLMDNLAFKTRKLWLKCMYYNASYIHIIKLECERCRRFASIVRKALTHYSLLSALSITSKPCLHFLRRFYAHWAWISESHIYYLHYQQSACSYWIDLIVVKQLATHSAFILIAHKSLLTWKLFPINCSNILISVDWYYEMYSHIIS